MTKAISRAPACQQKSFPMHVAGYTAHELSRKLRLRLVSSLRSGVRQPAFASIKPDHIYPRADDLEAMMAAFPGLHLLDYEHDVPCPATTINYEAWLRYHSEHCTIGCTPSEVHDDCYFKPLSHMLRTGFHAVLRPGMSLENSDIADCTPAYVDLWNKEPARCTTALKKLLHAEEFVSKVTGTPEFCFPLLPVIRKKDVWRHETAGVDYKIRLTSDSSTAGVKSLFEDIRFRYLGVDDFARVVEEDDYISSLDIRHFYTCLGAGPLLRRLQYFQDPHSYAASTAENTAKVKAGKATYLHQQTCMFGFKQLPWWASCVSAELARILTHNGCTVAGLIIDDILMRSPAADGRLAADRRYERAKRIMRDLGLDPNEKGVPPCHDLVFTGLRLRTPDMSVSITEEHRKYAIARIKFFLGKQFISTKDLQSLAGTLSWLCYVLPEGRPRRDAFYAAIRSATGHMVRLTSAITKQLRWWLARLQSRLFSTSRAWPRKANPKALLMRTDASGDHGFGICVSNLHIFGSWRDSLAPAIKHDMLFKEALPFAITTALLAPVFEDFIFAVSSDNAGMVFRVNAGSSRNPLVQRLLRLVARQVQRHHIVALADWNDREQDDAKHADDLSKTFTQSVWRRMAVGADKHKSWLFDLVVHDIVSGKAFAAVFRIPSMD